MKAFHADRYVLALPPGHRFPASKYRRLRGVVEGWIELEVAEAEPTSDTDLALAHTADYVRTVASNGLTVAEQRAIGFPWSEAMVGRSRCSVGATIAAARAALVEGIAANLAGGTHHASAGRGGGYCVFNDVAVAARLIQAEIGRTSGRAAPRHRRASPSSTSTSIRATARHGSSPVDGRRLWP